MPVSDRDFFLTGCNEWQDITLASSLPLVWSELKKADGDGRHQMSACPQKLKASGGCESFLFQFGRGVILTITISTDTIIIVSSELVDSSCRTL